MSNIIKIDSENESPSRFFVTKHIIHVECDVRTRAVTVHLSSGNYVVITTDAPLEMYNIFKEKILEEGNE